MSTGQQALVEAVTAFAHEVPTLTLICVCDLLGAEPDLDRAHARVVGNLPTPDARTHWTRVVEAAHATEPLCATTEVAWALRAATTMDELWRSAQDIGVVWTGPTPGDTTLRRTEQALLEVVDAATNELWVVAFAAYRLEHVCRALVSAAARGVTVRIVLESEEESGGKLTSGGVAAMPTDVAEACQLYVWPRAKRPHTADGKHGTLHAKCAVADEQTLFVSSANITEFAFDLNIELGLIVRGTVCPRVVTRQLRWMLESGAWRPVDRTAADH